MRYQVVTSAGKVTTSCFGDVLLRRSLPTNAFINTFFDVKEFTSLSAVEPWMPQ